MATSKMVAGFVFMSMVVPILMFRPLAVVRHPSSTDARIANGIDKNAMLRRMSFASLVPSESSTKLYQNIPKLIVFDLDNTCWAPELYQFRKRLQQQQQRQLQSKRYKFGQRLSISNETTEIDGNNSATSSTFVPKAYKDVKLTRGFQDLLKYNILQQVKDEYNIKLAIASRSKSVDWAHSLLDQFEIRELFDYVEIYPGSKEKHFQNLHKASGIEYNDMLFFDDTRDGQFGNCIPVSQMGVLSVHCPKGLNNIGVFTMGINKYKEEWDRSVNSIVEYDGTITPLLDNSTDTSFKATAFRARNRPMKIEEGRIFTGVIKKVEPFKKYGFIEYRNGRMRDVFFHYNSITKSQVAGDTQHQSSESEEEVHQRHPLTVHEGDTVSFSLQCDPRKNYTKYMASNVTIVQQVASVEERLEAGDSSPESQGTARLVPMRCVSMNQPFASLVANGYKTLESRNGTMFTMYPEGTQLLLHVTKHSTKPSHPKLDPKQSHIDIMKSNSSDDGDSGITDEEIEMLKQLPKGYGKGDIVAILEIGKTYEMSMEERSKPSIQRRIVLSPEHSGKYVTEIKHVSYLTQPIKNVRGQPGIFKVQIDPKVIPVSSPSADGKPPNWIIPSSKTKEELVMELFDII